MPIDLEHEIVFGVSADDLNPLRKSKASDELALLTLTDRISPLIPRDKLFRNPLAERIERDATLQEYTGESEPETPLSQTVQKLAKAAPVITADMQQLLGDLYGDEPVAVQPPPAHAALFRKAVEIAGRTAERKARVSKIIGEFKAALIAKGYVRAVERFGADGFVKLQRACEQCVADAVQ